MQILSIGARGESHRTFTSSYNLEAKRLWAPISRNPSKLLVITIGAQVVRASILLPSGSQAFL